MTGDGEEEAIFCYKYSLFIIFVQVVLVVSLSRLNLSLTVTLLGDHPFFKAIKFADILALLGSVHIEPSRIFKLVV